MMKRKPDPLLLKRYMVKIESDTTFRSHARLLQSIWREEKGYPIGEYARQGLKATVGNLLDESFAKSSKANFLTSHIGGIVEKEVSDKNKLIREPRIWNNLLSSQPLSFNLFGELKCEGYHTATQLFKRLLGEEEVKEVTGIDFEYSPGRNDANFTGDKTAFDVFVTYRKPFGNARFVGIEVKYAEDMKSGQASNKPVYKEIAQAMNIFKLNSHYDILVESNIQQIWRDHLLAGSMFVTNKLYEEGSFMIIYPEGNVQCVNAIDKYKDALKPSITKTYFHDISIEKVIGELENVSRAEWITAFKNRYLSFQRINDLSIVEGS
jgi:hypothetical protein